MASILARQFIVFYFCTFGIIRGWQHGWLTLPNTRCQMEGLVWVGGKEKAIERMRRNYYAFLTKYTRAAEWDLVLILMQASRAFPPTFPLAMQIESNSLLSHIAIAFSIFLYWTDKTKQSTAYAILSLNVLTQTVEPKYMCNAHNLAFIRTKNFVFKTACSETFYHTPTRSIECLNMRWENCQLRRKSHPIEII